MALPGKNAGMPITQSAPRIGPTTEPRPPITTIDTRINESLTVKNRSIGIVWRARPRSAPPSAAMPPARANDESFTRVALIVYAGGAVGVVAHADRGPPDAAAPEAGDDDRHHGEHAEHHVVERPLIGDVEPEQRVALERDRTAEPAVEDRLVVHVLRRGQRERERADGQHQSLGAQRAEPDERGDAGRDHHGQHERDACREGIDARLEHAGVAPADVDVDAAAERRRRGTRRSRRRPSGRATTVPPTRSGSSATCRTGRRRGSSCRAGVATTG